MSELKPCPFCGATFEIWCDKHRTWALARHRPGCFFPSEHNHEIPEYDFDAWNARAQIPGEVCEIEGHGEDDRTTQLESLVLEMRADIYGAMCDMFSGTPWGLPVGTAYDKRIAALGLEVGE